MTKRNGKAELIDVKELLLWRDNQGERRASIKMRRGRSVCDGGRA